MVFLKVLIIIIIVISCLLGALYILGILLRKNRYKQIQGKKLSSYALLHETVCSEFFRKNVFTGYFFPSVTDSNGVIRKYTKIDSLVVTKGGVAVISICDKSGRIDNSKQDIWVQSFNDKIIEFENPSVKNESNKKVVYSILKSNRLNNIPLYNIVVFTDKNAELLAEAENVFRIDELAIMLRQLNHESALTLLEMFKIKQVFDASKRTHSEVKAYMQKLNGKKTQYIVED